MVLRSRVRTRIRSLQLDTGCKNIAYRCPDDEREELFQRPEGSGENAKGRTGLLSFLLDGVNDEL